VKVRGREVDGKRNMACDPAASVRCGEEERITRQLSSERTQIKENRDGALDMEKVEAAMEANP